VDEKTSGGDTAMFELEKQIQRLKELRQLARQIQNESEQIREQLLKVVKSVGGKLVVGSYILSASAVQVVPYAKVLDEIRKSHPELSHEIEALIERFKTNAERLDIAEKEN
jgi:DNA repair ATPase RecN